MSFIAAIITAIFEGLLPLVIQAILVALLGADASAM